MYSFGDQAVVSFQVIKILCSYFSRRQVRLAPYIAEAARKSALFPYE